MTSKIGIVGLGLGYSLAHYLAYKGNDVIGVDIRREAWEKPRVDDKAKRFIEYNKEDYEAPVFTIDYDELSDREQILIFVSTPFDRTKKRLDIGNVLSALNSSISVNTNAVYQVLSTLPIGGWSFMRYSAVEMYYTPPMVKRADFIGTFKNPPGGIQMIGYNTYGEHGRMKDIVDFYRSVLDKGVQIVTERAQIIEKTKLLINLMLSTRIILANSIRDWVGEQIDAVSVCSLIGSDKRIGNDYFVPGSLAAGPCFPRDLIELESAIGDYAKSNLGTLLHALNSINGTEELIES